MQPGAIVFFGGRRCLCKKPSHARNGETHLSQGRVRISLAGADVLHVDLPRGVTVEGLVGGVASPQALYEHGGRGDLPAGQRRIRAVTGSVDPTLHPPRLPVEMLLPLLLLDFEGESGAEDAGGKCEERDGKHAEAGGDYLAHPRVRDRVPVSDRGHRDLSGKKTVEVLQRQLPDIFSKSIKKLEAATISETGTTAECRVILTTPHHKASA